MVHFTGRKHAHSYTMLPVSSLNLHERQLMFEPSRKEVLEAEELLASLLTQGRAILKSPAGHAERIREQLEEAALRSAAASALALARLQWRPRAAIALINTCVCRHCGSRSQQFAGFGVLMYRNSDAAERIVMTPQLDPAFPRRTHHTATITEACAVCLPEQGFNLTESPYGKT